MLFIVTSQRGLERCLKLKKPGDELALLFPCDLPGAKAADLASGIARNGRLTPLDLALRINEARGKVLTCS
ncbi:MAG: hypothetical protein SPL30_03515 [Succinivibrio sp.]|jgi:hypothetical protein|nr:hypothetical protein [Succinivibrio sp.]